MIDKSSIMIFKLFFILLLILYFVSLGLLDSLFEYFPILCLVWNKKNEKEKHTMLQSLLAFNQFISSLSLLFLITFITFNRLYIQSLFYSSSHLMFGYHLLSSYYEALSLIFSIKLSHQFYQFVFIISTGILNFFLPSNLHHPS